VLIGADGIWSNVRGSQTAGYTWHLAIVIARPHTITSTTTPFSYQVRASMTGTASRGDESGVSYSGYTVFAGKEYSRVLIRGILT
jgi:2-polyprenyl-6-methoxyphenol hydroxylase-like FAD-dependent oxidoreductase